MLSISIGAPTLLTDPSVLFSLSVLGGTGVILAAAWLMDRIVGLAVSVFRNSGAGR